MANTTWGTTATPIDVGGRDGIAVDSPMAGGEFFISGTANAMHSLARQARPAFPVTIYYAFKQSDTKSDSGAHSTGWETFLDAVLRVGFVLTGTWPVRTEGAGRMIASGTNALAYRLYTLCERQGWAEEASETGVLGAQTQLDI